MDSPVEGRRVEARPVEARSIEAHAIEVRDLTKTFGDFVAVDRVTFDVARGEIFGYLGANGAGKSTTIRILSGLLLPTSGQARVHGVDVASEPERVKRSIGYMSQRFSLYPDLSVTDNLEFFGGAFGMSGRILSTRIDELLERGRADPVRRTVFAFQVREAGFDGRIAQAGGIVFRIRHQRSVFLIIRRVRLGDQAGQTFKFDRGLFARQVVDRGRLAHTSSNSLPAAARASSVISAPDNMRAISSCLSDSSSPRRRVPPDLPLPFSTSHCDRAAAATCGLWVIANT